MREARGSSGWHEGKEDETFAAGSPLEAHGRFSKERAAATAAAVALAFLGPAFRSGNLMLVVMLISSALYCRRVFPGGVDTRFRNAVRPRGIRVVEHGVGEYR